MPRIKSISEKLLEMRYANLQRKPRFDHKIYVILYSMSMDFTIEPRVMVAALKQLPEAMDMAESIRIARINEDRKTSARMLGALREVCQEVMNTLRLPKKF